MDNDFRRERGASRQRIILPGTSAGSIEGISAACAHDSDVTAFHETSTEVAVGWQAVLDSWKADVVSARGSSPARRLLSFLRRRPPIEDGPMAARAPGVRCSSAPAQSARSSAWIATVAEENGQAVVRASSV